MRKIVISGLYTQMEGVLSGAKFTEYPEVNEPLQQTNGKRVNGLGVEPRGCDRGAEQGSRSVSIPFSEFNEFNLI